MTTANTCNANPTVHIYLCAASCKTDVSSVVHASLAMQSPTLRKSDSSCRGVYTKRLFLSPLLEAAREPYSITEPGPCHSLETENALRPLFVDLLQQRAITIIQR